MARQYEGQVRVVGVAGRDQVAAMRDFVERHDLGGVAHVADLDGSVWARFGVPGQPTLVLFAPGAVAVARRFGVQGLQGLQDALDRLLAASPPLPSRPAAAVSGPGGP